MTFPWIGAARRALKGDFVRAAETIGCEVDALRAVWQVEASGNPFRIDGSLERRFEPHKLAKPQGTSKASLKLSFAERERRFAAAYARDPQDACAATSWGGPQIMGFNARKAGHVSAVAMVKAFAESEANQIAGFVAFVTSVGLDRALRAHDWRTFGLTYNGSGNVDAYAARIESAYQAITGGKASPVILRLGSEGEAVSRLQAALGLKVDGSFGKLTQEAVRAFQANNGLTVDGMVGAVTWARLETRREVVPLMQEATEDRVAGRVKVVTAIATGIASTVVVIKEAAPILGDLAGALPETSLNILIGGAVVLAAISLSSWAFQRHRGTA